MTRIFSSPNFAEVGLVRGLLEENHVRCIVRNEHTSMAAGAIPFADTWPELWVMDDAELARAREVLTYWQGDGEANAEIWTCPSCGEEVEGQFTACWSCSAARPA